MGNKNQELSGAKRVRRGERSWGRHQEGSREVRGQRVGSVGNRKCQEEAEVIGMVRSQEVYGGVRTDQRGQQRVKRGQGFKGRVRRHQEVSGGSRDPGGGERS